MSPDDDLPLRIPDDARELAEDARRLRRERRAASRAARRAASPGGRRGARRAASPGASRDAGRAAGRQPPSRLAVGLLIAGVAAFGVLLAILGGSGRPVPRPAPRPLATPAVSPGAAGGLLPDVELAGRARPERARDLRPGVVMLVAPRCDCLRAVRQTVREAAPYGLVTYLVQAGRDRTQVEQLAARSGGTVAPLVDPDGVLARIYRLHSAAALVLVRDDGVVVRVIDAVAPSLRLAPLLRSLVGGDPQRDSPTPSR